jgi:carbon storage regulator
MLVLSRRRGECIRIDEYTIVRVLTIRPNVVELGIQAPLWVRVDREEIYERRRLDRSKKCKPSKPS